MPLTLRFEPEIYLDIIRGWAANSGGRLSEANIGAILRTLAQEGLAPEFARGYQAILEAYNAGLIDKAQGNDLDLKIADFMFADAEDVIERLLANAAAGYATFFGLVASSGTATGSTSSTLTDSGQNWTVNAFIGKMVRIISNTGIGQERKILSNTSTALTLNTTLPWTTWSVTPPIGSKYQVISLAASDVSIPKGTVVYAAGATQDERIRFRTTKEPSVPVSSTATGGSIGVPSLPTLTDALQAWSVNEQAGRMVVIRSGTGAGQLGVIRSNTTNTLTIVPTFPFRTWTAAPDGTSVYDILEAKIPTGAAKAPTPIVGTSADSDHNVAPYSVTSFEASSPSGIGSTWNTDAETNPAGISNGADKERDPDFRERFRGKLQKLTRGTHEAIIRGVLDYTDPATGTHPVHSLEINQAVYPAIVYIEDGSGTAASAPLVATIQRLLDATGEFLGHHQLYSDGFPHTAAAASIVTINVVVTINTLRDGFTFSQVKADITSRLRAYFTNLRVHDHVKYDIFLAAAVATGVLDLGTATLNGSTGDINIGISQKAALGTLSVS